MLKMKKLRTFAVCITLAAFLTSCYGSFGATKLLYNWNGSLGGDGFGGRFLRTFVMWVIIIIPAYHIFMFGDLFILNLIEFFTGTPLLGADIQRGEDGIVFVKSEQGNFKLTPVANERFMVEKDGVIIGEGTLNAQGELSLLNFATAEESFRTVELPQ